MGIRRLIGNKNFMKFKQSFFVFGLGVLIGCIAMGGARLYSGFFTLAGKHKTFPIQMKVNFGSLDKPDYEDTIYIEQGTTPKEAVSQVFPVLSGMACCSFREVIEIGGVRINPAKNLWWTCTVNGSRKISPQNKKLRPGDTVEWKYIQDSQ